MALKLAASGAAQVSSGHVQTFDCPFSAVRLPDVYTSSPARPHELTRWIVAGSEVCVIV